MTLKSLNTRSVKLMGAGLLLATVSMLSPTHWSAEASGFNQRLAEADNSIPALQGVAATAYLKEHKLYDSLMATVNAAQTQRADYSAFAQSSVDVQKLTASDGAGFDNFGWSVAVSGSTAVVGARADSPGDTSFRFNGSAYVLKRQGGRWVEEQKLTPSDGPSAGQFGWSVAISGSTIVVGSLFDDVGGTLRQGSVYVFNRQGGGWVETQKLTASDGMTDANFGYSVAISGSTIVVGAVHIFGGINDQGSVYVFNRQGGGWVETQKLTASDGAVGEQFGYSVAISGSTIVVGARNDTIDGNILQGSAFVFNRQGGSWVETQKLTASDGGPVEQFGVSVAVSGSTIVVGEVGDDSGGGIGQGSAYVFNHQGGSWVETQKLIASDGAAMDLFGFTVAVSGSTIVVGAPFDDISGIIDHGSAYVFNRQGGGWVETQKLIVTDVTAEAHFSFSIAVSGSTIIAGAPEDIIDGKPFQGSVFIFEP